MCEIATSTVVTATDVVAVEAAATVTAGAGAGVDVVPAEKIPLGTLLNACAIRNAPSS